MKSSKTTPAPYNKATDPIIQWAIQRGHYWLKWQDIGMMIGEDGHSLEIYKDERGGLHLVQGKKEKPVTPRQAARLFLRYSVPDDLQAHLRLK